MPSNKQQFKVYDQKAFTTTFMQPVEIAGLLKGALGKFLMVRVEEMYRLVTKPVPASRATTHTVIYLTEGEANMHIGSTKYTVHSNEMLFVPAGQVFSFGQGDVNKGYLCNFDNEMLAGKFGNASLPNEFEFLRVWGNPKLSLGSRTAEFVRHILSACYWNIQLQAWKTWI